MGRALVRKRGMRQGMHVLFPPLFSVTGSAESGESVRHDEEFVKGVVVGVMAGGALDLITFIKAHLRRQGHGCGKLTIRQDKPGVIGKGYRVIIREIRPQP